MAFRIRKSLVWYIMIAPAFILYALFVAYPTLETFRLSLYTESATRQVPVGAWQYVRLLGNQVFLQAILNTVLLGIAFLALVIPASLLLALLLEKLHHGSQFFKAVYFLPQMTSGVAVALIFGYVFQSDWGLVNGALRAIGVEQLPLWLAEPRFTLTGSRAAVTLLAVWMALGYYMLIFLAGLQAISRELYDAAMVDGAGPVQLWWYVTIPSLRPTFVFLVLTGTIDAVARFSDVWMLGGPSGSPARSLQTIVVYIYQTAFESGEFNLASAAAVILFFIMLALTLVNFRVFLQREFASR